MTLQRIHTIGHSTRELEEFAQLLTDNGVSRLVDIRRYPGSKRYPHFSRESLSRSLPQREIEYLHLEDLGGRRRPDPASPHVALRNDQFRAYADHMATPEFTAAIARLLDSNLPTAIMCAEAVPWRCHRNMVSDYLVANGIEVVHIMGERALRERALREHTLNRLARVDRGRLVYDVGTQGEIKNFELRIKN